MLTNQKKIFGITPLEAKKEREDDYKISRFEDLKNIDESIYLDLTNQLKLCCEDLIPLISKNINLRGIEKERSVFLDTRTIFNISNQKSDSLKLFINRHKVNDFKRINDYFSTLNEKMTYGGYIIGCCETIDGNYRKYREKYSKSLSKIFYFFNFIFKRVIPKLPILQEINYILTNGQNRSISKTEILGRVVYSGFKIIETREINGIFYFLAAKVNVPYDDKNPSYGPFISLKRVGKGGRIMKIYKFRTMHPYSEYIQDYVFEKNSLAKGGKMKDDFRITGWGKIFRKLWIDELPQFINLVRGDIKLVGVRALSPHYFNLYPKEFQEFRIKFKPGILPPFYVDLPETIDEIVESERKYLNSYSKYKILTDIKYFWLIMYNIIFKGKRSA